jgi:hypothetical protein
MPTLQKLFTCLTGLPSADERTTFLQNWTKIRPWGQTLESSFGAQDIHLKSDNIFQAEQSQFHT